MNVIEAQKEIIADIENAIKVNLKNMLKNIISLVNFKIIMNVENYFKRGNLFDKIRVKVNFIISSEINLVREKVLEVFKLLLNAILD